MHQCTEFNVDKNLMRRGLKELTENNKEFTIPILVPPLPSLTRISKHSMHKTITASQRNIQFSDFPTNFENIL